MSDASFLGGPDAEWRQHFDERPYDTQASESIVPPAPQYERARPVRVDRSRRVLDYNPQSTAPVVPGCPSVWQINTSVACMALGGVLPFPVRAIVTPLGALSTMPTQRLIQLANALQLAALSGFSPPAGVDLATYWIMAPGDILDLGARLDGCEGFFFAPWCGLYLGDPGVSINQLNSYRLSNLQAGANAAAAAGGGDPSMWFGPSYDPARPTAGPIFAPIIRVTPNLARPVAMPVQFAPWVVSNIPTGLGGDPTVSTVCIPPNSRYVTVTFASYSPAGNPVANGQIQGRTAQLTAGTYATPMDAQVQWLGFDGLRHSHPMDQLTAAARGQVSNLHDIEVFEVPKVAAALSISTTGTSGPVPCWSASFSN